MNDGAGKVDSHPDDARLCQVLDRYLEAIHSGDDAACAALLREHPEISPWTSQLGALDRLSVGQSNRDGVHRRDRNSPMMPPGPQETTPWFGPDSSNNDVAIDKSQILGQTFGNYELLEEAGRGGMGVVFKARQRDLERVVALKMILSSRLASDDEVRRFHQEAKAAAGLRHPNVVGIHEVGQVHGQHYFTMDFVAGRSLAKLSEAGPMEPDRAARLMATVASAVEYLHSHGIVHRDLKPSNILLDDRDEPMVTDFGLAKVFQGNSEQTRTGAILGTPSYMAPEQARGNSAEISPRTDVYSLGAVLYELLTGRPPFREENQLDTILQVLEGEPTLPHRLNPRIPLELERIVLRAIEKLPANRYESAAALANDLEHYLRHEPLETRPIGLRQRIRRFTRRQPALVAHEAAILATAAIVHVNYVINRPSLTLYTEIMSLLAIWLLVAILCQTLLLRERTAALARYAWATLDVILLTAALYLTGSPLGPLVVGYPLIVAGSGLWFRMRLVWFTTGLSLISYAVLVRLMPEETYQTTHPYIFAVVLALIGFVTGYQLHRLQVLSRYFEQQRGR
ncbi:MAG TPA: serine/threonine-protein kinase [Pirellulales bacterium]|nr:serine/threonine-protein kinase [Pirellulales bacterium]